MMNFEFEGKEYKYDSFVDEEEDNRKIFHEIWNVTDQVYLDFDWSPYRTPYMEDIILWMQLGQPGRSDLGSVGPLRRESLQVYKLKIDAQQAELF